MLSAEPPMLLEVSSATGTTRLPIRGRVVSIGRATDNDVVLDNEPTVSRHHAELVRPGSVTPDVGATGGTMTGSVTSGEGASPRSSNGAERWTVRDLGSHNGTHVNGVRLGADDVVEFSATDVVGIGSVTIRLVADSAVDGLTIEDRRGAEMHRLLTVLSDREREVLTLVAAGHTDDQCAKALFISVKTVHSHLDRIRDKTGVRRRAELTRLAVRLGLSAS